MLERTFSMSASLRRAVTSLVAHESPAGFNREDKDDTMRAAYSQLTEQQIAGFHDQGYLALEQITTRDDVRQIQSLLDALFDRFDKLPKGVAIDLGEDGALAGPPKMPEVNSAVRLEPRLRDTLTFANCQAIAAQLLGRRVNFAGDHAIYKPPHNQKSTPWHQDQAYLPHRFWAGTVSFWVPLQDVTVEMGCMRFIPHSQRQGLLPHRTRSGDSKGHVLTTDHVDPAQAVPCPIPAGGATIHSPLTLHMTGPNDSDTSRRVWILAFTRYSRYGLVRGMTVAAKVAKVVRGADKS